MSLIRGSFRDEEVFYFLEDNERLDSLKKAFDQFMKSFYNIIELYSTKKNLSLIENNLALKQKVAGLCQNRFPDYSEQLMKHVRKKSEFYSLNF